MKAEFILNDGNTIQYWYESIEALETMMEDFDKAYSDKSDFWFDNYNVGEKENELYLNGRKLPNCNYRMPCDKVVLWSFEG